MAILKAAIITVTPFQQNCSVIWKEDTKVAAVTDPGGDLELIEKFINDQNLKNINEISLRNRLGIIPQDIVMFNDSIFYNIHYGNLASSKDDCQRYLLPTDIWIMLQKLKH